MNSNIADIVSRLINYLVTNGITSFDILITELNDEYIKDTTNILISYFINKDNCRYIYDCKININNKDILSFINYRNLAVLEGQLKIDSILINY